MKKQCGSEQKRKNNMPAAWSGKKRFAGSSVLLALFLILCLQAACCCAETSEASAPFSIEAMLAANSREAILNRHESLFCTVELPFDEDFSFYVDRETSLDSYSDQTIMLRSGEVWYDMNPGGEEKKPEISFYAMPDAERDAMIAPDPLPTLDADLTPKEEVQSVTDNKDGTLTVVTRLSPDPLAAIDGRNIGSFPDEYLGYPAETVYTLDAETLELLSLVDSLLVDGEKIMYSHETVAYDVPRPECFDRIVALWDEFGTAEEGHIKTVTVVYDAGTEAEERYTLSVNDSVGVFPILKEGYLEERRESSEGNGLVEVTIWASPAATGVEALMEQAQARMEAEDYAAAFSLFEEAAGQNDPEALTALGYMHGQGLGTERDYDAMLECYNAAAELGEPMAMFNLGCCYRDGTGVEKDLEEMIRYFELAAAKENANAQFNLGFQYYIGEGVEQDYDRAFALYQLAADQEFPVGMFAVGDCYFLGNGVEADAEAAAEWYRKALAAGYEPDEADMEHLKSCADQGNAVAQNELGKCYSYGIGVGQDEEAAVKYYRMAAEQGFANSQYNLANCYLNGVGVEQDAGEANAWLTAAADQGLYQAQSLLGYNHEYGIGTETDIEKAAEYYQAAADQGDAYAQNNLGLCYYYGRGVGQDTGKAIHYYTLAAKQGEPYALNNLGTHYCDGNGVKQDYGKAMECFQRAAEQGIPNAIYNIGYSYYYGEGVEEDGDRALEYFREAAEMELPEAVFMIGECYYEGKGAQKDPEAAAEWYRKALAAGYEPDEEDRVHLLEILGPDWE